MRTATFHAGQNACRREVGVRSKPDFIACRRGRTMTNEEIVGRIQQGETGLMDRLLEQNRGFIYKVAKRYLPAAIRNRGMDLEDLAQAACVGMIEAVPAWDSERGSFLTVAVYYMTCSIRQELGFLTTKQRFENQEPPLLLSTPAGEDGDSDSLLDLVQDATAVDPQLAAEQADMQRIVRDAVADLPDQQRDIVRAYYIDGRSMAGLSALMGYSPEKSEQIKRIGIKILRRNKRLRLLWMEYEAAAFTTRTFSAWKNTHTSAVEAGAMRRELLRKAIAGQLVGCSL